MTISSKNKKNTISFKGTDYLNISKDEEFRFFLQEGIRKFGSCYGGSRLSGNFDDLYSEAENKLAKIAGTEAALSFSSGTLAGVVLTETLKNKNLFYSPSTHPALFPNANYLNGDRFKDWVSFLLNKKFTFNEHIILLSNSINALKCKKYDFSWLLELPKNIKITLILDDSHGFGILGVNGGGIYKELPVSENIDIVILSSLGKAWGIPGGIILGSEKTIDELRKTALFGGASPTIPAYFHAFLKSEFIYIKNRNRLLKNISYFKNQLVADDLLQSFNGFPAFYSKNNHIYSVFQRNGIEISSFNYPSPTDEVYTRIVLSSVNSLDEIDLLNQVMKEQVFHAK